MILLFGHSEQYEVWRDLSDVIFVLQSAVGWLALVLLAVWLATVLWVFDGQRKMALEASTIATGRQAVECRLAARAAWEQMLGIWVGVLATLAKFACYILAQSPPENIFL